MTRLAVLFGLFGLAVATAIIIHSGYDQVAAALQVAGWGILWTSLYHLFQLLFGSIGWRVLMPGRKRPSLSFFVYLMWLRGSVNNLMPVARVGGEVLAVRVMMKYGVIKTSAIATTIVELTMSVIAVFLFDLFGIGLFTLHVADTNMGWKLVAGLALSVPAIAALVVVQRIGFFGLLSKIFSLMFRDTWKKFAGNTAKLDHAVHVMYRRRKRVLWCGFWQLMAWSAGVGEIWLSLYFLGHPLPWGEAFMLEALIQATASAAFVVPGALGVQEAGFLLFGHMLGLSSDVSVALAVMRRCRDLLFYVPGLIAWQVQEGRWLLNLKKQ